MGLSVGGADHGITAVGASLDWRMQLGSSWNIDSRITLLSQSGNDIEVVGMGDIYLNLGYKLSERMTLTGGVKIPLTDGNAMKDGRPLPMDYQSSLGTLDLILGAGFRLENWQILLGWQQPLTDNQNSFESWQYEAESPLSEIQSTNQFRRKGDLLLRIARPLTLSDKLVFTPSLLPIYHLGEDLYTDTYGFVPVEKAIDGSDGLTINMSFQFDLRTGPLSGLQFALGTPLVVRESRPDGLTRGFVLQGGYRIFL